MPRTCAICAHEKRQDIERAIFSGKSLSAIAALFRVSPDALQRHKQSHLPDKLAKAQEAKTDLEADGLLREIAELREKLRRGLAQAEQAGSGAAMVAFAREYRNTLETFFNIADRMAERAAESGAGDNAMKVVIEHVGGVCYMCPKCNEVAWLERVTPEIAARELRKLASPETNRT